MNKEVAKISFSREAIKHYDWENKFRYDERVDKYNIFPIGLTDSEFRNYIVEILLGGWYSINPLGHNQVNEEALEEIIYRLTSKTPKERDKEKNYENKTRNRGIFKGVR